MSINHELLNEDDFFNKLNTIKLPNGMRVGEALSFALKYFVSNDDFLLFHGVNERTISSKLAHYIQDTFNKFDYVVDCEYNRMCGNNLTNEQITKRLCLKIQEVQSNDVRGVTVFPDIIVHKRGNNGGNLFVIEIKKSNACLSSKKFDREKLNAYKKELFYQYGVYIEFNKSGVCCGLIV